MVRTSDRRSSSEVHSWVAVPLKLRRVAPSPFNKQFDPFAHLPASYVDSLIKIGPIDSAAIALTSHKGCTWLLLEFARELKHNLPTNCSMSSPIDVSAAVGL